MRLVRQADLLPRMIEAFTPFRVGSE